MTDDKTPKDENTERFTSPMGIHITKHDIFGNVVEEIIIGDDEKPKTGKRARD